MDDKLSLIDTSEALDDGASMMELLRKVLLASVGAVSVAQEEIEAFVNRLIERGEIAEADGRQLLGDIREQSADQQEETRVEKEKRLDRALKRANIPTKSDIAALGERITQLTEQVDDLLNAADR